MKVIDSEGLDVSSVEVDKLEKQVTFSLLIPARGARAASGLSQTIATIRTRWMEERRVIDEIGVLIDPDENGVTHDMRRIALKAGASWALSGEAALRYYSTNPYKSQVGKGEAFRSLTYLAMGSHLLFQDAILDDDASSVGLMAAAVLASDPLLFVNGNRISPDAGLAPVDLNNERVRKLLSARLGAWVSGVNDLSSPLGNPFVIDARLCASLSIPAGAAAEVVMKVMAMAEVDSDSFVELNLPSCSATSRDADVGERMSNINAAIAVVEHYFEHRRGNDEIPLNRLALMCTTGCMLHDGQPYDWISYDRAGKLFDGGAKFLAPLELADVYQRRTEELKMLRWYALDKVRRFLGSVSSVVGLRYASL